jgi:hypothetical protein
MGRPAWMVEDGSIPRLSTGDKTTLIDELVGPNYGLDGNEAIQLEAKKDMRRRGIPSPNVADALACTFAYPSYVEEAATFTDDAEPAFVAQDYNPYDTTHMRSS